MSLESDAVRAARRRRSAGTTTDFAGNRLALARRLARQSRTALARTVGVSPSAITQFEKGVRPTAPILAELALALGVPRDFFRHGRPVIAVPASSAHFRSLRATPALSRDQALAFAELALDVIDVLEHHIDFPAADLPHLTVPADPAPAEVSGAADECRASWGLPAGPIGHVVRLAESHGVLVLRLPDTIDRAVDAFSAHTPTRPLILLSPVKNDKARSRFDAAHELGHLVMHPDVEPGDKVVEAQAHAFAAQFLMPADEIAEDLPRRLDWGQLHRAKQRWGTSLRALVYRAHTLGIMSDATYRRANQQLQAAGNPEAGPLGPPESPALLGMAAEMLADQGQVLEQLAKATRLPIDHLQLVIDAGTDAKRSIILG